MEKGWRRKFDDVKDRIMDGYRRGVCSKDGVTIKTAQGRPVAKPRTMRRPRSLDSTDTFLAAYRRGEISI